MRRIWIPFVLYIITCLIGIFAPASEGYNHFGWKILVTQIYAIPVLLVSLIFVLIMNKKQLGGNKFMNKKLLLIISALFALVIAGCSTGKDKKEDVDISGNYVPPATILKDIEDGKTFTFAIVDKDCSACQAYKANALKEMESEDKGSIRYIEVNGIDKNEKEFKDVQELIETHLAGQFEATPTTYFIKDGELSNIIVGTIPFDELKKEYEKNNKKDSE